MGVENYMSKKILVTGGAGYIGSHTVLELLAHGYAVTIIDNLSNSSEKVVGILEEISGRPITFVRGDLLDTAHLENVFRDGDFDAVIHFAGLKAVGESVAKPLNYYRNNVQGSANLIEAALRHNVYRLLFSSSATVYGHPKYLPIDEKHPIATTNPYGETKRVVENMLQAVAIAEPKFQYGALRYFNPIGAHHSGLIGEDPKGIPNNLVPYIAQVAVGQRAELSIWGNDYETVDGTGVRDYIHVADLSKAHLKGVKRLFDADGSFTVNLGTGNGYSVLEVVRAFEEASGKTVPFQFSGRRPGDVETCYADPSLAETLLGWRAEYGLDRMCQDHWRWQEQNPDGLV